MVCALVDEEGGAAGAAGRGGGEEAGVGCLAADGADDIIRIPGFAIVELGFPLVDTQMKIKHITYRCFHHSVYDFPIIFVEGELCAIRHSLESSRGSNAIRVHVRWIPVYEVILIIPVSAENEGTTRSIEAL